MQPAIPRKCHDTQPWQNWPRLHDRSGMLNTMMCVPTGGGNLTCSPVIHISLGQSAESSHLLQSSLHYRDTKRNHTEIFPGGMLGDVSLNIRLTNLGSGHGSLDDTLKSDGRQADICVNGAFQFILLQMSFYHTVILSRLDCCNQCWASY